jgi:hypothetical protein
MLALLFCITKTAPFASLYITNLLLSKNTILCTLIYPV